MNGADIRRALRSASGAIVAILVMSFCLAVQPSSAASHANDATSTCGATVSSGASVVSNVEPCVISMTVGSSATITLSSSWRWTYLGSSSTALVVSDVSRPSSGGLTATLTATAPGTATLSSGGTMVCTSGVACPALARLWSMQVVISGANGPVTLPVTQNDSGADYSLSVGDSIDVRLAPSSSDVWTVPTATSTAVVRRSSVGSSSMTTATFKAARTGTATLRALERTRCASPGCRPRARAVFTLVVHVS